MLLLLLADSFQNQLLKKILSGLNSDQDRHTVGPDLGPNCLQRWSADDKSPLATKEFNCFCMLPTCCCNYFVYYCTLCCLLICKLLNKILNLELYLPCMFANSACFLFIIMQICIKKKLSSSKKSFRNINRLGWFGFAVKSSMSNPFLATCSIDFCCLPITLQTVWT